MTKKNRCKKCNSSQTYYVKGTDSFHCVSCGNDFKIEGDNK